MCALLTVARFIKAQEPVAGKHREQIDCQHHPCKRKVILKAFEILFINSLHHRKENNCCYTNAFFQSALFCKNKKPGKFQGPLSQ